MIGVLCRWRNHKWRHYARTEPYVGDFYECSRCRKLELR